jgi:hypothetical protein
MGVEEARAAPVPLEPPRPPELPAEAVVPEDDNDAVDLGRLGWLITVIALSVTVLILFIDGYYGYGGVTLAVALSAAINLAPKKV